MRLVGSIHPEVLWVTTHGAPGDDLSKHVHGLQSPATYREVLALCSLYMQAMECRYTDTMQQCCHLASMRCHGVYQDPHQDGDIQIRTWIRSIGSVDLGILVAEMYHQRVGIRLDAYDILL